MSLSREKRSLSIVDSIPFDSLVVGLQVEAQDADPETQGMYYPGRIIHIDRSLPQEQWRVTVKFDKWGDNNTVTPSELRPHGWSGFSKLQPQEQKRPRTRPPSALGEDEGTRASDAHSDVDAERVTPNRRAKLTRTRSALNEEEEFVVVIRVLDDRDARDGGSEREYLCKLGDGTSKWLPRRPCLEEEDKHGVVTTVGALLAYEWSPAYIVQTYNNGEELLVAWKNRPPSDWARIPASAFHGRDLQSLRGYNPGITELSKQNATHRLFMGIQDCLRATAERSKTLEHFSAFEIEAVLGDLGTPDEHNPKPALAGDRTQRIFSHEELDPLFRPYREKWDELRSSRGKLLGRIDFSEGRGVHIIWYARPAHKDFYTSAPGRLLYLPLKHSTPYVEYVKVSVRAAQSTEAEDEAVLEGLTGM